MEYIYETLPSRYRVSDRPPQLSKESSHPLRLWAGRKVTQPLSGLVVHQSIKEILKCYFVKGYLSQAMGNIPQIKAFFSRTRIPKGEFLWPEASRPKSRLSQTITSLSLSTSSDLPLWWVGRSLWKVGSQKIFKPRLRCNFSRQRTIIVGS